MSMWRPPERIRHPPRPGRWPTAEEAARSRLYSPVSLGPLELGSRTWVPAMVPWRATAVGDVTPDVLDWYRRFAQGQPGAIVVEATGVRDVPSGPLLRIHDDRFVPGLRELVRTVHEASAGRTRVLIQLIDFLAMRRRPEAGKFFARHLRVTASHRAALGLDAADEVQVRAALAGLDDERLREVLEPREYESYAYGARERVTDTDLAHVADLPRVLPGVFAAAARRARAAGFDGIELHCAHAYTLASFLSPLNVRTDGYGSTLAGRLRLPLEVYAAVRAEVGVHCAVGCRFLAEECVEGGGGVEDARAYALAFAAAGADFLSLSRGGKFEDARQPKVGEAAYPYTGRSGYECMPSYYSDARGPFGRNVAATAAVRAALRDAGHAVPVIVAGGIHGYEQAEQLLADGGADVVALARAALADPDWFRKVRGGHGAAVRVCLYTNYCEALDQRHRQVTCELWDRQDLDAPGVARSTDGRRRLVAPPWDPGSRRDS